MIKGLGLSGGVRPAGEFSKWDKKISNLEYRLEKLLKKTPIYRTRFESRIH